jgi:glutamate/tyrosine decarboxylase-like PLP-dependent enzyme
MANTTALAAARDHQLAQAGWDVQADGLFGAPELTVVIGEYAHSTVLKALGLVGLGRNRVRRVPADDQGRMRADCLPEDVTGPVVICAQAGEVNTGAFDPFPAIVEWARRRQAWVHVDGAFGLWALTDPSRSHLTAGLADADSWATDGHKWLNVPYDCGIALVRRSGDLRRSFATDAATCPPIPVSRPRITPPVIPARPAGRGLGDPAHARQAGRDRSHHAHLPPCADDVRLPRLGCQCCRRPPPVHAR